MLVSNFETSMIHFKYENSFCEFPSTELKIQMKKNAFPL
jgi:hypothetical protein